VIRDDFYFEIPECSSYSGQITLIVNMTVLNFDSELSDDTCLMIDLSELAIVRFSCM